MIVWLMISVVVRLFLVALITLAYVTLVIRIKGGFTDETPPYHYNRAICIATTVLYFFHFVLPT